MGFKEFARKILPKTIWKFLVMSHEKTITMLFYVFRIFPIKRNKIVLDNFAGRGFGDNPKYIALEFLKQNYKYDLVWLVNDEKDKNFPEGIRVVKINSLKAVFEQVTARIWIDNCRKSPWVRKRKGQYYVQTWHGNLGPKKCEKDAEENLADAYIRLAKNDSKMIDLCISNGKHISDLYRNSFWYDGEIFESGTPRNDIILNISEEQKQRIRQRLGINGKLCLYAPTFRDNCNTECYNLDYEKLKDVMETKFGGEFSMAVRLHPNMSALKTLKISAFVFNLTSCSDMQELLSVSDILITDYSSSIYDFGFSKRPAFIFATDMDDYKKTNRNLYFELEDTPFGLAKNTEALASNIMSFDEEEYKVALEKFYSLHSVFENGDAAKKVADRVMAIITDEVTK